MLHNIPSLELRCRYRLFLFLITIAAVAATVGVETSSKLGADVDLGRRGGGGGMKSLESVLFGISFLSMSGTGALLGPCSNMLRTCLATMLQIRQLGGGSTGWQY